MAKQKHKRKRHDPVARIRKWDDPALKAVCQPIEPAEVKPFLRRFVRALKRSTTGVGLAAPQIGILKRAVLVWPKREGEPLLLLNPEIIDHAGEHTKAPEGCLSYPGITANITRRERVRVKYDEPTSIGRFKKRVRWFVDFEARIVQHEIDHLNGICRVGDAWRARRLKGQTP